MRTLQLFEVTITSFAGTGAYGVGAYGAGYYGSMMVARAQLGPQPAGVKWQPVSVVISTPSQNIPQFFLYRNLISQASLITASVRGNADQVAYAGPPLSTGQILIGQWIGGDQGSQASMTITGTKTVPGKDDDGTR